MVDSIEQYVDSDPVVLWKKLSLFFLAGVLNLFFGNLSRLFRHLPTNSGFFVGVALLDLGARKQK